ncbi:hypothetical protein CEXT_742241 [Caerostris extrusa]|uniref:Uncharacterized protein n=1 Tax=Caerostris extrusa TaxID=172846 RepID=A0AAV4XVH1_CAEEX|nr:hypothetical protein CEXT_742241 [Caerostris extrusa]
MTKGARSVRVTNKILECFHPPDACNTKPPDTNWSLAGDNKLYYLYIVQKGRFQASLSYENHVKYPLLNINQTRHMISESDSWGFVRQVSNKTAKMSTTSESLCTDTTVSFDSINKGTYIEAFNEEQ